MSHSVDYQPYSIVIENWDGPPGSNFTVLVQCDEIDDTGEGQDLNIYKYRRRFDRDKLFILPTIKEKNYDDSNHLDRHRRIKIENESEVRQYTILQEAKPDFAKSKLRSIFLIFSNPYYEIFILSILLLSYIIDTCLFTFYDFSTRPSYLIILIICLNIFFTVDVIFLFVLKFSKKWRKNLNLEEPQTYRIIIDGILAMPYGFFYFTQLTVIGIHIYAIVPLVAIMRQYRIIAFFYHKSTKAGSNQWSTFLFHYLILFFLCVHTFTCVWYLFSYGQFDIEKISTSWSITAVYLPTESTFDWYLVCTYWSFMFLSINALGDLYPVTTLERIATTIAIMTGFILTTIVFVGSLTSQFITITTRRANYVRQLQKIQNHLKQIKMDSETTKRVLRYYEDLWYQKSGVFKPQLLELLPAPLQMEICYDLNAVPLFSSLIFRKLPEAFLRRLSLAMTHQFYLPGDIVYCHNKNKTFMVCITNGVLEFLSDEDDDSAIISFRKGTCFGEISLVYNIPARCTVKAATYVECQVLNKVDFIKLMMRYPEIVERIKEEINQRIIRSRLRMLTKNNKQVFGLNIYASKSIKKSNIKCLKDKLRYLQGSLDKDPLTKDDYLDENCLDLYVLSEHVKKKKEKFTCVDAKFPWILDHDCNLVRYWELYMLLIVFYISLVYPYCIGYLKEFPEGIFYYIDVIITMSLVFNVNLSCVTAIKTKKSRIKTAKEIIQYKMQTLGFYLDILAIIPFEYLIPLERAFGYRSNYNINLFHLIKGVKLCLVWRLSSFFEDLEKKLLLNMIALKVAKYCTYIILLCYWCGVILYMESCFIHRCCDNSWFSNAKNWDQKKEIKETKTDYNYVAATYFATTLLLSVGYGDFSPGDTYDLIMVSFLSLYGVLFIGYCVAEFSAVITHWSRTRTSFLEIIITIEKFMHENNMDPHIKSRIMAFYDLQWQYNKGVELTDDNWLEKTVIPAELRKKVLHQARFKAITSIKFLQVKNKAFIHTITEMARDILLPPGEIVYYGGTVTRDLYIIESGYCLLTSNSLKEKKQERVIGPGNHLGLLVLLYGVPAVSTVITLTHCKLISISHSAYTSALSLFPDMREHDGLLTSGEISYIEELAKRENFETIYQHRFHSRRDRLTNFIADSFDESFINVYKHYKKQKESYIKSFRQFQVLNKISIFLLIPITIKPDGTFIQIWCIFSAVSAFSMGFVVPITVSMAPLASSFNLVVYLLEVISYMDIIIKFHVAYYGPKNQLIYHPYMTAKHYLKTGFLLDFLTSFPWYALVKALSPRHDEDHTLQDDAINSHFNHCSWRMISILQIYKVLYVFSAESISALKRSYLMSVVQFLLVTLLCLNLYTNILIMLTCRYVKATDEGSFKEKLQHLSLRGPYAFNVFNPEGNMICQKGSWIDETDMVTGDSTSPMKVYLLALYWAVTSFSGAGFGDITAQVTSNIILSMCINLHGALFFGYVYARIASLRAMADKVTTKFQENLKHLEMFLTREAVPLTLKKTIIDYWKYQWKRTGGWSHQSILGKLHANLNEDAVLYLYEKTLREIPLFEGVENSFFRAFAKKLSEQYFQKGHAVIKHNEVVSYMYIIYRGKVDILTETGELEVCMGPGGIFGNIRGPPRYLTQCNVVASRNIDLLCITGPEFYSILKNYPSVLNKVKTIIDYATKDYVISGAGVSASLSNESLSPHDSSSEDIDSDFGKMDHLEETDPSILFASFMQSPPRSMASHESKSNTSATHEAYTSAAWLLFLPHRWFRSSVIPDCKMVTYFDNFILIVAYTDFMLLTYQMAFMSIPNYLYICITLDILFLYKTFLDMHTGYINRYGDYVLQPKRVRKMYFSKVVLRRRDFLNIFIVGYLAYALPVDAFTKLSFFVYLRTPQLTRITYIFTYQTHRKITIGSSNLFLKLMSIGIWASILSHVNACLFYKLSCLTQVRCISENWLTKTDLNLSPDYAKGNYFSIYIAALWYMINLLTITGTGDVTSQNDFEVIETIVVVIVIKFCTGLLISEMSALITAHQSSLIAYDYGINELRDGLRDMDLSDHQMTKMWDYVRELWNRQLGKQMPELIGRLPFRLRCQVMDALYGSHVRQSVIFSKTSEDFRRMLAMWVKHCVFFPGNYIVQCGDSDQCIYFIHRGEVEVLTVHPNLTESIYDILGPEDSFGIAQGLFVGIAHHFSFRARTVVDIVYLQLDQWKYLLDFYPKSSRIVHRKVQNVYLAI